MLHTQTNQSIQYYLLRANGTAAIEIQNAETREVHRR